MKPKNIPIMKNKYTRGFLCNTVFLSVFILTNLGALGQDNEDQNDAKADSVYKFIDKVSLKATPVKDQYKSGTCWVFSGLSFLESELLRQGKGEFDLSEMYLVNRDYHARAIDYVRWQGAKSFSGGAESNNVFDRIDDSGIVPEDVYPGLNYGSKKHVHEEMDDVLTAYIEVLVKNPDRKLSTAWLKGFDGILSAYLGDLPKSFAFQGKTYTPESFRDYLGIDKNNYFEITSFTHHPFYTKFVMEVPDNWALGEVYNVPIDELLKIAYNALDKGYTILWGSDISEKGFSFTNGVAIVPEENPADLTGSDRDRWKKLSEKERKSKLFAFKEIVPEKNITQEMRQEAFDTYSTTDDHGLHIIGYALDQNGNRYFKVKNSWNTDNIFDGYFYVSEAYYKYKTLTIVVHKDVIPADIRKKLNL
jgi:bleomycin hydrolase